MDEVLYETRDGVAIVTMNRPQYRNAQNAKMTYALDECLLRAMRDDAVKVIVLPRAKLEEETMDVATRISAMPRFGLALAKKAINQAEDRMGLRDTIESTYGLHHVAHAHNAMTSADHLAGHDPKSMKGK